VTKPVKLKPVATLATRSNSLESLMKLLPVAKDSLISIKISAIRYVLIYSKQDELFNFLLNVYSCMGWM